MSGMIEVAKATVTIVPNMEGSQKTITNDLTGASEIAGEKAGKVAGEKLSSSLSSSLSKVGSGLTKGVTVPLVAAATGSVAAWKEVDSALDTVATKTGATGKQLESLTDSAKKLATDLPTSFEAAGDAVGEVNTKFGTTGDDLEILSAQFIKFASLNETDVSLSVDTVANTLAAFGEDAGHASAVLDAMNVAGQATGISMEELGTSLQNNAAVFTQMGLSVEQAAGVMASLNTAGLTTAQSQTALRTAMKSAAKDGMTMNQALAEFGKTMNSSASDTEKLQAAYDLFGTRAGASLYNAFQTGKISAEDFAASMTNFSGSVSQTFETTLDPMDRFTQAMNGIKLAGAEVIEAAAPLISTFADVLVPAITGLADGFASLPSGVQTAIVAIGGIAAAAGPVVSVGSKLIGGIPKLVSGISGIAGHFANIGSSASSAVGGLTSVASSATTAATGAASAASGFGAMAGGALQIVALGASFVMVGKGLQLMADGAVALANGGLPAAAAMVEMTACVAALMGVAAALGPALTAGALGIGTFGAAILAIGGGIDLATTGIARLVDAVGNLMVNTKAGGEGLNLIVDALKRMTELNLINVGIAVAEVGKAVKTLGSNSEGITAVGASITALVTSMQYFSNSGSTALNNFNTTAKTVFASVKAEINSLVQAFKSTVFEFGGIKLPHFSMSGKFDAESGTVPKVSVDWYAKAAESGAVFSSPQIIGVGDASQPEMLVGEKTLYENISEAVGNNNGDVYVYIGNEQLDAIIQKSNRRTAQRRGV